MRKILNFPKDSLEHDVPIEWWYFNGHLKDKKNNDYSFMNCLFKIEKDATKLPLLRKIPIKHVYSAHYLISDISEKKFYSHLDHLVLASKDSFSKPNLFINYASPIITKGYFNSIIEEIKPFQYYIKTEDLDLILKSTKKPLLVGGTGFIDLRAKNMYYYSLTNMDTKGKIRIKNKWIEVTGKSWMDHQWNNTPSLRGFHDAWFWFSVQLDNNTELICFEYSDGKTKLRRANISNPNGKQEDFDEVLFRQMGKGWTSSKTKVKYGLDWEIEIPEKNLKLTVSPMIKNQEMRFGTISYWEGPLHVKGKINNTFVKGKGFLEIANHPFQIGELRFLTKASIDIMKQIYLDSEAFLFSSFRKK